jgi:hypothetical protein
MSARRRSSILLGWLVWLVYLAAWAPSPVVAAQKSAEEDKKQIELLEHEWLDGGGDRATLERVLASDFVHPVSAGVFLSKEQHIAWSLAHPRPANRRARFETLDVRLYGDAAIANGIVENTDLSGSDRLRTIFTDVFVRRGEQWQAVSACENTVTLDPPGGKELPRPKH